ncbi:long-chain-fatty-acid--CoA ligase [Salinibacterium hongtaonis]|uniref:long-chain-fatty-acid--CoA ligase n=1 Tax=Homoserinimonas hongtaonis TaxID=2079791 RepID=UPI000D378924|nr:long-chain fatty acid--CoA ligase [Salinibacterium hongtaonis]AWB88359.1 long-chain fatty acid--CoA ligase [Salinibacterium hongtaonis]
MTSTESSAPSLFEAPAALTSGGFGTLSVATILSDTAHRFPERTALIYGDSTVSYGDLWQQTLAYAGALRARGVRRGDRVAILIPNVPDFARAYYAILSLGAVVVPVHLLLKADEIAYVLRDSGSSLLIAAAPMLAEGGKAAALAQVPLVSVLIPDSMVEQIPVPRLEDEAKEAIPLERYESTNPLDAATILYTSGTTGRPKGAVGCHVSLIEQVHVTLIDLFNITADDVVFGGLPLFHTFGQTAVLNTAFRRGAAIILLPKFDPDEALALMVKHGATLFTAVPTMFIGMLEAATRTAERPPLRYGISGGASLPVAILERFAAEFGARVHEGYGLTETSPIVSTNHQRDEPVAGTVGRPIWGVDVEIADADIDDRIEFLPQGELGEIVVRGHALFKGYLGRPEADAEAVVDGWFRTGDLGTKGADDRITIVDRKKDMIVRNGYNVYPREVEEVLARLEGVGSAAVFGVAHDKHGQEVAAAIVLAPGSSLTAEDVIAYTSERMAAYKFPRIVEFHAELPLGASGKVLKRELSAEYAQRISAEA